jgi:hypothetical protein
MAKVAIVGAGQAGMLTAHALHQRGYDVTVYSDKTPEDFLTKARPTGSAFRFKMALDWERELGLEHWADQAPHGEGVHLTFSPKKGNQLLTLLGRLDDYGLAIDVRLQSATWMREFEERGGRIEIENVTPERLDDIAGANDLTIVAGGRPAAGLFEHDAERSHYTTPQRQLAMVNVTGIDMVMPYAPWFTPVKFNFFGDAGEAFWVPWFSKDLQPSWSLIFEAKGENSPFDRFRECRSAEEMLATGKRVIQDMTPWDAEWVADAVPCDENAWLTGSFVPEVRKVVGTLPSGRNVMALGDTAQALDPIGGQGANNGNKMSRVYVESIVERGEGPFDAAWMEQTFDRFWERHHWIEDFNHILLEPLTGAGKMLLMAQYGSTAKPGDDSPQQKIANTFFNNFNDPAMATPAFQDTKLAKQAVKATFGSTMGPIAAGARKVARGQLRQKMGKPAGHPGT